MSILYQKQHVRITTIDMKIYNILNGEEKNSNKIIHTKTSLYEIFVCMISETKLALYEAQHYPTFRDNVFEILK